VPDRHSSLSIDGHTIKLTEAQLLALATGSYAGNAQPTFEKRILWRVCENGKTRSAVVLAAEEWTSFADACTTETVMWALESLNEQGLVVYALGERGIFTNIRATPNGYEVLGYPPPSREVGRSHWNRGTELPLRTGDTTDFRTFDDHAWGGPIEKMLLEEHIAKYPDHPHIIEEIDVSKLETTLQSLGQEVGDPNPVRSVATEITLESASKKDMVLTALFRNGMAQDVSTLVDWTKGMDHGLNPVETTKLLWALQKQSLVRFKERRVGHSKYLYKIELTTQGTALMRERFPAPVRKAPVERFNTPTKPQVVPAPAYEVPAEPRYSAPPPPPQNTKSFTDEERTDASAGKSAEVQGREREVDTHTQYRPEGRTNLYPNSKGAGGVVSMERSMRGVEALLNAGGEAEQATLSKQLGLASGAITVMFRAAEQWGWVEYVKGTRPLVARITESGRRAVAEKRALEGPMTTEVSNQIAQAIQPMRVVARDFVDETPKAEEWKRSDDRYTDPDDYRVKEQEDQRRAAAEVPTTVPGLIIDLGDFPLIRDLMGKEARIKRYEAAAALLMEDGDDTGAGEMAMALLEKIQVTDLEKEVIRYVRAITG
jgi:hypothetical protein